MLLALNVDIIAQKYVQEILFKKRMWHFETISQTYLSVIQRFMHEIFVYRETLTFTKSEIVAVAAYPRSNGTVQMTDEFNEKKMLSMRICC